MDLRRANADLPPQILPGFHRRKGRQGDGGRYLANIDPLTKSLPGGNS
ncbi:MAG: hypothetical protein MZV64_00215 [Ignavibacteriales bacterium]|nr:hypothetical protein [Ignavibacteriales bacterium]